MLETTTESAPVLKDAPAPGVKPAETAMSLVEAARLEFLEPKKLRFFLAGVTLRLTQENHASWLKVSVLRSFPLSHPDSFFSVRDTANKEIGLIKNPAELDAESRKLVVQDVDRRYMVSTIQKIIDVKERFGTVEWNVQTQRGTNKFTTRDLRDNVVRPLPTRYLITDVEGNRYDIPDINALDANSQAFVMQYV
jgi:hypothetical protein